MGTVGRGTALITALISGMVLASLSPQFSARVRQLLGQASEPVRAAPQQPKADDADAGKDKRATLR